MYLDLSREICEDTQVFPLYPKVKILTWAKHDIHGAQSEVIYTITHVATHMDAPLHFIENGLSIDKISIEKFIGYAVVIDVSNRHVVTGRDIESCIKNVEYREGDAIFLYTGWEDMYGRDEYVYRCPGISKDAAEFLVSLKPSLVGIDSPSIDPAESTTFEAHKILLSNNIPIIENLCNLKHVLNRRVRYYAIPLKIVNATASPVRVIVEV